MSPVELSVQRHIESCLRCQAELARYRRMLRGLQLLRTRYLEPAPGLARRRRSPRSRRRASARRCAPILSGRRLAYAGAIGGAAVAASAPRPRCHRAPRPPPDGAVPVDASRSRSTCRRRRRHAGLAVRPRCYPGSGPTAPGGQ